MILMTRTVQTLLCTPQETATVLDTPFTVLPPLLCYYNSTLYQLHMLRWGYTLQTLLLPLLTLMIKYVSTTDFSLLFPAPFQNHPFALVWVEILYNIMELLAVYYGLCGRKNIFLLQQYENCLCRGVHYPVKRVNRPAVLAVIGWWCPIYVMIYDLQKYKLVPQSCHAGFLRALYICNVFSVCAKRLIATTLVW